MAAFNLIYLGWIKSSWIKEIDPAASEDQSQTVTLKDTRTVPPSGSYNVARIKIPGTTNEHFIVENRQGTGSDQFLSGNGLVIWHMAKSFGSYNSNGGMDVEIATPIGADGEDWLDDGVQCDENYCEGPGFAEDFFNSTNKSEFMPWTNPSTETGFLYSGSHSFTDLGFANVQESGTDMIFDFLENSPPAAPQNLVMVNAGNNGENPVLEWDANSEPDLQHYAIYKGYQDSKSDPIIWNSTPTATTTNTTWTDPFTTIDTSAPSRVHYRITAVDDADNESDYSKSVYTHSYQVPKPSDESNETIARLPEEFQLHANYPNPFNPHTLIRFDLPEAAEVTLKVFNLLGEEIRTLVSGYTAAGFHALSWDGTDGAGRGVPSGIYIYRLEVRTAASVETAFTHTQKMTLLR